MKERKKIALVLSGGSALGFAHIGVIKVLEEYNIPIDIVVGTSMGSVVGAGYAIGLSVEDMSKLACKFKTIDFFDVNVDASGLFSGKGVMRILNKFLPDVNIETLEKSFACVAADLILEKEIVFKSGSIRDAVRSSLSIPGVFVPFKKNGQVLVDGGTLNNLPEDVAMEMGADIIISCDVIKNFRLQNPPKNILDTLIYSMNLCTKEIQKYKSYHSDITIYPDLQGLSLLSFSKKKTLEAIKKGEEATRKEISKIMKLIK